MLKIKNQLFGMILKLSLGVPQLRDKLHEEYNCHSECNEEYRLLYPSHCSGGHGTLHSGGQKKYCNNFTNEIVSQIVKKV